MPEGSKMESLLGVAMARLDVSKRYTLSVFEEMYAHMFRDGERTVLLSSLMMAHMSAEYAAKGILDAVKEVNPDAQFRQSDFGMATAHLEVQPGTVNPINKALLEALKRLVSVVDVPDDAGVMKFTKQAISEAEKGLGENLGSSVPKGSNTEVRGDSFLQALYDIQAEAMNERRDAHDRLHRIVILTNDLINSHLERRHNAL